MEVTPDFEAKWVPMVSNVQVVFHNQQNNTVHFADIELCNIVHRSTFQCKSGLAKVQSE